MPYSQKRLATTDFLDKEKKNEGEVPQIRREGNHEADYPLPHSLTGVQKESRDGSVIRTGTVA